MTLLHKAWRWVAGASKALKALLLTVVVTALAIGAVTLIRGPSPLIVMQLDTELLVQRVARPELSSIPVVNARLSDAGNCAALLTGDRFTGVVRPPAGALLTYHWEPERLLIEIEAPPAAVTLLSNRNEDECGLQLGRLQIALAPGPGMSDPSWQLPIAGPAVAGSEFGAPLAPDTGGRRVYDLLRGGTISVYGKSLDSNRLFPVSDNTFEIPAGSRVASAASLPLGDADAGPSWYGVALYDKLAGLQVSATTEAGELLLFRPSPGAQRETFGIGLLAGLLGDRGTATFAFAIAAFFAIGGLLISWMSLWRDPKEHW